MALSYLLRFELGRIEEAIASYDKALDIKPDKHKAWYNKACAHSLLNQIELALNSLEKAIRLSPEENIALALEDSDFDNVRSNPRFRYLAGSQNF